MFQRKVISEEEIAMYNCMINDTCCYIYNLIKNRPLYSPINKMDSFLLSFLSNWYNKRRNSHEVVKDEFDIFVRKGWLPRYNKGFEYTRNEEYAITINFTEEGYYEYLEKSYFRHFCNPSENSYAWNCRPNNMIKLINIIKDVVGNDILNKIFNDVTSDKNSRLQKDSLLQKYHRDGKLNEVYTWDTMKRVIVDTFPIEDIVLPYDKWKFNIELAPDRLKRGLFYSLFYNSPKNYSQREILVTQLYYKYYGFVEGHYFDTVFEGLHGEFGTENQRLLSRLLALSLSHEQKIMESVLSKYNTFCEKNGIPPGKYLGSFLSHKSNKKGDIEPQVSIMYGVGLGMRPESFTNEQLCYLVELLAKDGKPFKPLDDNNKDKFLYFIGAKDGTSPYKIQKIEWNGNVDSLKYFIYKLYERANGKKSKLKSETWRTVANTFMCPNRKKVFAKINYSTIVGISKNKIEKNLSPVIMSYINECFLNAEKYRP